MGRECVGNELSAELVPGGCCGCGGGLVSSPPLALPSPSFVSDILIQTLALILHTTIKTKISNEK